MKAEVILYKHKTLSNGEFPLMLRLSGREMDEKRNQIVSKQKYHSLKASLPAVRWNEKKNRYKPIPITPDMTLTVQEAAIKLNAEITALVESTNSNYADKIRELARDRRTVTLDQLYQEVEHPITVQYAVLQWMEKLRDEFRAVDNIGQGNIYDNTRRLLSLFLSGKDISFYGIDVNFLARFEHFLRQRKVKVKGTTDQYLPMRDSTISIYMRTLRAAIAKAIKLGYTKCMPFDQYKIPKGRPNKRALSESEMLAILNLKNRTDDHYRYLLFSYYTIGMNFTDIARLTWDNIRGNEIHYTRQKVHHKLIIPMHPKIKEILDHYRGITGRTVSITGANDNYIFPILHKEVHKTELARENRIRKILKEFNKELKNIGASAKVDTVLTSYVLRHTAITNLVRLGITADAIQALAGHKRLTTTENYIREASQEVKSKAVNML